MKILVAYTSKTGVVEDCAKKLSEELAYPVDLVQLRGINDPGVEGYDWVIIGSSLYKGKVDMELKKFLDKYFRLLGHKNLVFFCCGASAAEIALENFRLEVGDFLWNHAHQAVYFGGELRAEHLGFFTRLMIKRMKDKQELETSIDWGAVRDLGDQINQWISNGVATEETKENDEQKNDPLKGTE